MFKKTFNFSQNSVIPEISVNSKTLFNDQTGYGSLWGKVKPYSSTGEDKIWS
jgi:hypothetical protein